MIEARLAAAVCALTAWAISMLALVGHLVNWTGLYRWRADDVGMAINTAVAVNLLAVACFILAATGVRLLWERDRAER